MAGSVTKPVASRGDERQGHADRGAAAAAALDAAGPAEQAGPLAHAREPEPAPGRRGGVRTEAHAVVAHLEMEPAGPPGELDLDLLALRVSGGVDETLLQDAEGRGLHRPRHAQVAEVVDEPN